MGNSESHTPEELKSALERNPSFQKIRVRAKKMGVDINIQGDASIQIQNTKDLVKGNARVPPPDSSDLASINSTLAKITESLEKLASDCGFTIYGYQ
jgi:hypothetical protein